MKKKLSLQDFAEILAQREDIDRKAADAFARSFFDIIEQGLQTDKFVKIKGFGTFKLVAVSERESVNINTGERFQISGHTKVSFTPDSTMKELVNRPFAHFEAVDLNDDTDTKEFEVIDEEMGEESEEEIEAAPSTDEVETTDIEELDSDDTDDTSNDNGETEDAQQTAENVESADEPNDSENLSDETPIEIITDQASVPTQEEAASTPLNKEPSAEPNVTPTTSVTNGNKAKVPSPTAQAEATNTAAIPNKHHDREDIVVTDPTPISSTQATNTAVPKATTAESAPTNATMGYTYNEVPSPHKRNWWKTLSLLLLMLVLMAASYFAGYYRMLCPTCDNYLFGTKTEQPVPVPTKEVQPAPVARPANTLTTPDSNVAHADTAQKANQKQSQPSNEAKVPNTTLPANAPTQSIKAKPSQPTTTATPQRPKTHCVGKGENIYRIARKYYGDDSYAEKIIKANNLKDANTIVIGMELKLP